MLALYENISRIIKLGDIGNHLSPLNLFIVVCLALLLFSSPAMAKFTCLIVSMLHIEYYRGIRGKAILYDEKM